MYQFLYSKYVSSFSLFLKCYRLHLLQSFFVNFFTWDTNFVAIPWILFGFTQEYTSIKETPIALEHLTHPHEAELYTPSRSLTLPNATLNLLRQSSLLTLLMSPLDPPALKHTMGVLSSPDNTLPSLSPTFFHQPQKTLLSCVTNLCR